MHVHRSFPVLTQGSATVDMVERILQGQEKKQHLPHKGAEEFAP